MSRRLDLDDCKTEREFESFALRNGATKEKGNGSSHVIVDYNHHRIAMSKHGNKQYGEGMRKALVKAFQAAGLAAFLVFVIWVNML